MAVDKRIYSSWAFSENEHEKAAMNREIYKDLRQRYKISRCRVKPEEEQNYDVIVSGEPKMYHTVYEVIKNTPGLTTIELALICDDGNLCFGYSGNQNRIDINTD